MWKPCQRNQTNSNENGFHMVAKKDCHINGIDFMMIDGITLYYIIVLVVHYDGSCSKRMTHGKSQSVDFQLSFILIF